MLADALKFLTEQAVTAAGPTILEADKEPTNVYVVAHRDGRIERVTTPPPQERRQFSNLDSLTDWAWPLPSPRAWVSLIEVRATVEDPRQSFGVLPVGYSPQLQCLLGLEKAPQWMEQAALVKLLRTTLAGCLPDMLVATFRNLRFVKNEQGMSNVQQDRANLGKALEAQVTGAGAIPETIDVDIPMVADPFLPLRRQTVKLVLEVDVPAVRFALHPIPGDLTRAMRSCELELYNLVVDAVIRNRPGTGLEAIEDDVKRAAAVQDFRVYSGKASV